jgi:hypothetical protein
MRWHLQDVHDDLPRCLTRSQLNRHHFPLSQKNLLHGRLLARLFPGEQSLMMRLKVYPTSQQSH